MLPALLGALVLFALEVTDVDQVVERWFYDPVAGEFPLRYNECLEVGLHYWGKYLVVLLGALAIAGCVLSFVIEALRPQRRLLLFVALALTLAPASVGTIKLVTNKHCPWELEQYGGLVPYTRLLESATATVKPGRCFPAGHASAGFALMAFFFVGRARGQPRYAWLGLALGLILGLILGLGRMAQGAHFLSHTLWSALVCWLVIIFLWATVLQPSER